MYEIFIGIVSNVIYSVLLVLFIQLLIPFIRSRLYKTPDIKGEWISEEKKDDITVISTMQIKQIGINIKAEITRSSKEKVRKFKYKGKIISGQIVLNWYEEKGENFNLGAMVLSLSGDLRHLKGKSTFYHHDKGEIVSYDRIYLRV